MILSSSRCNAGIYQAPHELSESSQSCTLGMHPRHKRDGHIFLIFFKTMYNFEYFFLNLHSFKICSRFGWRLVGKVALMEMGQALNQRICVGLVVQSLLVSWQSASKYISCASVTG
jgi:hypothetical protein